MQKEYGEHLCRFDPAERFMDRMEVGKRYLDERELGGKDGRRQADLHRVLGRMDLVDHK